MLRHNQNGGKENLGLLFIWGCRFEPIMPRRNNHRRFGDYFLVVFPSQSYAALNTSSV